MKTYNKDKKETNQFSPGDLFKIEIDYTAFKKINKPEKNIKIFLMKENVKKIKAIFLSSIMTPFLLEILTE